MQSRLLRLLPHGRFARGVTLLTGGTALGQLIVIASTPIITRLYTPQDLGLASSFLAVLLIIGVGASLRYDYTITLPEDETVAASLFLIALMTAGVTSLALFIIILLFGETLTSLFNVPELAPYLWLLPIGVFAIGLYQSLTYWHVRQRDYQRIAQTRISQSLGQVGIQVGTGLFGAGAVGMILGYIIGQASGIGTLARPLWTDQRKRLTDIPASSLRQAATRYRVFPFFSTPAVVLNSIGLRITPLVMAALFGLQVAGWYSFADRLTSIPVALMSTSIGQAFLAEASRRIHHEPEAVSRLFFRLAARLFLLGCAIGIPLIVVAPSLLGFVFGNEWSAAGVYVQWWGLIVIVQIVVSPLSMLNLLELVQWQFAWDTLRAIFTVGGLVIAQRMNRTPEEAMAIYAITMFLTYGILFLMNIIALRRYTGHNQKINV